MSILFLGTSLADFPPTIAGSYSTATRLAPYVKEGVTTTSSTGNSVDCVLPTPVGELWFDAYYYRTDYSGGAISMIQFFTAAGTKLATVSSGGSGGDISIQNAANTTLASQTAGGPQNTLNHIRVHLKISSTAGVFQVWMQDILIIDFAGNTGTTGDLVGTILLKGNYSNAQNTTWSGIIVADESTAGMEFIQSKPAGAGIFSEWTGSYLNVDEIGFSDIDYITTNTLNAKMTFTQTVWPGAFDSTYDVLAVAVASRQRIGVSVNMNALVTQSGVSYAQAMPTQEKNIFAGGTTSFLLNPATAATWTVAEAKAAEFGVQLIAA